MDENSRILSKESYEQEMLDGVTNAINKALENGVSLVTVVGLIDIIKVRVALMSEAANP
jgi:hypothetical protein